MEKIVLRTDRVSKSFDGVSVLKDISLALEQGKIYGFIGQNGAGKSTLMKILTGLVTRDSGNLTIYGASTDSGLAQKRKRFGSMIESPAFYPEMSAFDNVNMTRISRGLPNKELVTKTLAAVQLSSTGKKKAKHFSMGMKQRLGLANALLSEPDLLILDEPNNGLDPMSIVEIRELLLKINREKNTTMLISSHILEELYHLATDFIIIHEGKIIEQISRQELSEKCQKHIQLRVSDLDQAVTLIETLLNTKRYKVMPDRSIKLYDYVNDLNQVITLFVHQNITIQSLNVREESLEDYFIGTLRGDIL